MSLYSTRPTPVSLFFPCNIALITHQTNFIFDHFHVSWRKYHSCETSVTQ